MATTEVAKTRCSGSVLNPEPRPVRRSPAAPAEALRMNGEGGTLNPAGLSVWRTLPSLALVLGLPLVGSLPSRAAEAPGLYPKNAAVALDPALFAHPTSEYRGPPFWAWNCKLDRSQLLRQIDALEAMGFGGFHMHVRVGLDTEYLGDEYHGLVKACVDKAQQRELKAWLYDEDRWPSGSAGGWVTRDPQYRQRQLVFTPKAAVPRGTLLGRYEVTLCDDGRLGAYRLLRGDEAPAAGAAAWNAFIATPTNDPWYNNQTYVDTLNPKAIERFVALTHERYAKAVGDRFGTVVPAIFTDEPNFGHGRLLKTATAGADVVFAFTDDFFATYEKAYGEKLQDRLPELVWELPDGKVSTARYRYYDHLSERFASAYGDTIGRWCGAHGIAMTGHLLAEETLSSQAGAVGDHMRGERGFQLPGIDMLCDRMELTTAKQAASVAHQYGRAGVLSELYGVTAWDFDFVGHKAQGDWQAALGVTVRVPHLAWVSMAGEAKRDYPAAIGWQSPWYKEYPLVEDHFARLNTALTRGRPLVRLGVVHPIESQWLCLGPEDQCGAARAAQDKAFLDVTDWLLRAQLDFDFVNEALLPAQAPGAARCPLQVGAMAYDAVLVPGLRTIRASTLERIEAFAAAGGKLVFAGRVPDLVDAQPSDRAAKLAARSARVEWERGAIVEAVVGVRELEVIEGAARSENFLHQQRQDGNRRQVFLCNVDREHPHAVNVRFRGDWSITELNTFEGTARSLASRRDGEWTVLDWEFPAHGDLLATLEPGWRAGGAKCGGRVWKSAASLAGPVPCTLSEPNVLLLDQAAWRLGDEPWQPVEEILRLDQAVSKKLGLPPRGGHMAQPWTMQKDTKELGRLQLKFAIRSDVRVESPQLAVELPERMTIALDGRPVAAKPSGWWVDECIRTIPLPALAPGEHELVLTIRLQNKNNIEWAYLLGDFGVKVEGRAARLVARPTQLTPGDWTGQALPFYAGNVTYHYTVEGADAESALEAASFKAPLLSIALDGKPAGRIAFAPWRAELGQLAKGTHRLDVTAYGNRVNAFGPVHDTQTQKGYWAGPNTWHTTGAAWSYDYQLKPMGLLQPPSLLAPAK